MSDAEIRALERAVASGDKAAKARLARERLRRSTVDWSGPLAWVKERLGQHGGLGALNLVGDALAEALAAPHGIAWRVVGWRRHENKPVVGQVLTVRPEGASVRIYSGGIRDPVRFAVKLEDGRPGGMVFANADGSLTTRQSDGFRRYALAVVHHGQERVEVDSSSGLDGRVVCVETRAVPSLTLGIADAPGIMAPNVEAQLGTPPAVAWPELGSARFHAWTYSGKSPYEPSRPQVERCRAWARRDALLVRDWNDNDRKTLPLEVARALADALQAEGTLFA